MFREHLQAIIAKRNLSETEMSMMIEEIFSGAATPAQIGAFMAALAAKGETFEELAGAARVMRRTTAFVVAGCGVTVAKHGNRSVSSRCGSADVVEALGVNLDAPPEVVEEALGAVGIGFLFAPLFHGAMKHAAAARREVGIRSIFNMLGPLTNPAAATCQLLGVYAPPLTEMFAQALRLLGTRRAFVVHGHDGLDEISACAPTRISELDGDLIRTYDITPEQLLGRRADRAQIAGGDPARNAAITRSILNGDPGAGRDVVLLNAAAALVAAGRAENLDAGIRLAGESIDAGAARGKLEALVRFTRQNG